MWGFACVQVRSLHPFEHRGIACYKQACRAKVSIKRYQKRSQTAKLWDGKAVWDMCWDAQVKVDNASIWFPGFPLLDVSTMLIVILKSLIHWELLMGGLVDQPHRHWNGFGLLESMNFYDDKEVFWNVCFFLRVFFSTPNWIADVPFHEGFFPRPTAALDFERHWT